MSTSKNIKKINASNEMLHEDDNVVKKSDISPEDIKYLVDCSVKMVLDFFNDNKNNDGNNDNLYTDSEDDMIDDCLRSGMYAYDSIILDCEKCKIQYEVRVINAGDSDYENFYCPKCNQVVGRVRCDIGNPVITKQIAIE